MYLTSTTTALLDDEMRPSRATRARQTMLMMPAGLSCCCLLLSRNEGRDGTQVMHARRAVGGRIIMQW